MSNFSSSDHFENSLMASLGISTSTKPNLNNSVIVGNLENGNYSLDEEIGKLQRQIDDTEAAIQNTQIIKGERFKRFQTEIDDIQHQIDEVKDFANDELDKQQIEFEEEIKLTKQQFDEELLNFEISMKKSLAENSTWSERRKDLLTLGDQTKIADLERKMENERAILQESTNLVAIKQAQQKMMKQAAVYQNENKIKMLEDSIATFQAKRRELDGEFRLKVNEITETIEAKNRDHAILIQKIIAEMNQRDEHFFQHIQSVKQMTDKEKMQTNSDNQIASNKIESLQKIYQSMTKRESLQLQNMTKDIEKLKKSLDDAKKSEEAFAMKSREQMVKFQAMQKEANYCRDSYQSYVREIEKIRNENQYALQELQKFENSARKNSTTSNTLTTQNYSNLSTTTRRNTSSSRRSLFYY